MKKLPLKLYTAAQVRELDLTIIKDYGIPGIELMSRAGNAVFRTIRLKWPNTSTINIFCGSGNNAGDGYFIACLALAAGMDVVVYTLFDPDQLKDNALTAYKDFAKAKGDIVPFSPNQVRKADVIVDAMLGIGLIKEISDNYAQAIHLINKSRSKVIAVDIPSGLHADTGAVMGDAVKAHYTVTFIGLKQGLYTGFAADFCGEIIFESLAVPTDIYEKCPSTTYRVLKKIISPRLRCSHKGDNGHVLIIGGNSGYSGAVKMAGEAALRVGSGLVSLATHFSHANLLNINRPELMCHGIENAAQLQPLLESVDVVVVGPGLGQGKWATELFIAALKSGKCLIIDADGLNLLALVHEYQDGWILTPHPGEAARLLNSNSTSVQKDRYSAASKIQSRYGGIVVLKGAGTLIASHDDIAVSTSGNPGMATGGMGDVLSGVIAGLIAQGLPPKEAAQQGVYIHGMAADLAVEHDGERGLLASDLMPYLRQLVNT